MSTVVTHAPLIPHPILSGARLGRDAADADMRRLIDELQFALADGSLWLNAQRVLIVQAEWFSDLRSELISMLGIEQARGLITRLGYAAGCRDGETALKVTASGQLEDLIYRGAWLNSVSGMFSGTPVRFEIDAEATPRHCYFEFRWRNSIDDHAHAATGHDHGDDDSCWMEVGYASGYLSTCLGSSVIVREMACQAGGAEHCTCIARFAEEWEDASADLRYLTAPIGPPQLAAPEPSAPPSSASAAQEPLRSRRVVGRSVAYNVVRHQIARVAETLATVLLLGESGVGKSVFAREIHAGSRRRDRPLIEVNCAAIPENLIEAELFGVEKGAFTGASASRAGRFEEADGGTLFLDEVATLSPSSQGKILRVLQSGEFERLGSSQTRRADVRLIAATNEDLMAAIGEKRFRLDLFYRLNVFPIKIPPLRERKADLPPLIDHFIDLFSARHGRKIRGLTPRAFQAILTHRWPGNIRELENVIERAIILGERGTPLDVVHLFTSDAGLDQGELMALGTGRGEGTIADDGLKGRWRGLAVQESELLASALDEANNNISRAADLLGITRAQMDYRVKKTRHTTAR